MSVRGQGPGDTPARRVRFQRRFTEVMVVGMVQTSSRTSVTISACTNGGRPYVRLQSFYRPAGNQRSGWRLGTMLVLPAALAQVLMPLLDQAATRAEGLPGALPDQTIEGETTDSAGS